MEHDGDEIISTAEAAACVGLSMAQFKRYVYRGTIPTHRITAGGHRLFLRSALLAIFPPAVVSVPAAARRLGCSPHTLRKRLPPEVWRGRHGFYRETTVRALEEDADHSR
jgi:hypothetical protein